MFEIGSSLREARLRQSVDLARAEDDTKIRAKYLQALEDERFDVLPSETYVKGFLRTYAEYLGLDGQLYVDEFNSRFATAEEPVLASRPVQHRRRRASESGFVVVTVAGIVAVAILFVVAFAFSNDEPSSDATRLGRTSTAAVTQATPAPAPPAATAKPRPVRVRLVLAAARGDCWVAVRRGAPDGDLVFSGTLYEGDTMRFTARRLWLEFGDAPVENLDVRLNGRRVRVPGDAAVVSVTPRGLRAQPS